MMANETKTELMNRFFESQNNGNNQHSDVLSPPLSDGPPSPSNVAKYGQNLAKNNNNQNDSKESVEDILAQLPPIDVASVLAEINSEMQQNSSNHDGDGGGNKRPSGLFFAFGGRGRRRVRAHACIFAEAERDVASKRRRRQFLIFAKFI